MGLRAYIPAACLLLVLQAEAVSAQQRPRAVLQGVVKHARTGEPVFGARVSIDEVNRPSGYSGQPLASVSTNPNGEFILRDVDPGLYRFSVGKNGFVQSEISRLTLASGETKRDIRLRPTGNVSGRVSTTTGKPAVGVTLHLLKRAFYTDGTPALSAVATARTDDRGEYRMFWVTPGRYYLSTEGTSIPIFEGLAGALFDFVNAAGRGVNEVRETYTRTYYPGVPDLTKAVPIDVQEGAELRGIDITGVRQEVFTVRGRLIDATGQPPRKAQFTVAQKMVEGPELWEYWSGLALSGTRGAYSPATGTFEIPGLAPGRYGLSARAGEDMTFQAVPIGTPWAFAEVVITGADIENLVLQMAVPPVIQGQIKVEGQLPLPPQTMASLRVGLTSSASALTLAPSATPAADGSFVLNAASDAPARVTVDGLPSSFYLKEALLGGNDVLRTPGKFSAAGNLEVTIRDGAGTISGRVLDAQARPVADAEVVLIPNQSRERSELFKRSVLPTNAQGLFFMFGIPPGDYKVFAWERIEPNSFFDEQVMQRYERQGMPVHIDESARLRNLDVPVIPEDAGP